MAQDVAFPKKGEIQKRTQFSKTANKNRKYEDTEN